MHTPRVTVLMPVYNGEHYLREAINSILQQSFSDFELLIIDDGSTDSSHEIIKSYSDPRIRLIKNESNLGISVSLNIGFGLARGKYLARMDSDDICLPDRLARQITFLEEHPKVGICGTWVETFGETVSQIFRYPVEPDVIKCEHIFGPMLAHPSVMMRREILAISVTFYDPAYKRAQDFELWVRLSKHTLLANIGEVLLLYRSHHDQVGNFHKQEQLEFAGKVRLAQLNSLGIIPTEEEFKLHQLISQRQFVAEKEFLEKTEKWFCKLISANKAEKIFSEPSFSKVLSERWLEICAALTELGPWMIMKYVSSPLTINSPSNLRCLSMFLNSLFRIKRL